MLVLKLSQLDEEGNSDRDKPVRAKAEGSLHKWGLTIELFDRRGMTISRGQPSPPSAGVLVAMTKLRNLDRNVSHGRSASGDGHVMYALERLRRHYARS